MLELYDEEGVGELLAMQHPSPTKFCADSVVMLNTEIPTETHLKIALSMLSFDVPQCRCLPNFGKKKLQILFLCE